MWGCLNCVPWAHLSQASAAHPAVAMVSDDGAGEVVGSPFPVGPVVRLAPRELCLVNNLISVLCQIGSKTYLP